MTIKNKETLEKLRTYQIGVIRSVITSRQGRLGTYQADATDRERLAVMDMATDTAADMSSRAPVRIQTQRHRRSIILSITADIRMH